MPADPLPPRPQPSPATLTAVSILGMTAALMMFLYVIRSQVIGFDIDNLVYGWYLRQTAGASYFDFLFVLSLAAGFLGLSWLLRHRERGLKYTRRSFTLCAGFTLLMGIINIHASGLLGVPVNYQWLYYSDFMTTFDANQAVADVLSPALIAGMVGCEIALVLVAVLMARLLRLGIRGRQSLGIACLGIAIASSIYFWIAGPYLLNRTDHAKLANPVVAFASSMLLPESQSLATMPTPFGGEDFATVAQRQHPPPGNKRPELRNVVVFVLESTPPEYCEIYGGKHPVTPTLKRLRPQMLKFNRIYAHAPSTNKSMVSMVCSIYPRISFRSISRGFPKLPVQSIADVLKAQGYRTALYHAADLRFGHMEDFLANRGFDVILDRRTIPIDRQAKGSDDEKSAAAFASWFIQDDERPFFGIFWTRATHMPYYVSRKIDKFGEHNRDFIRYLNALRDGDAALGVIVDALAAKGLSDDTLIVVLGDHGEAFGRHNQRGHGSAVYEENVHIPFLLIHPKVFRGGESDTLGGAIDLGPTIVDLLGIPPAPNWQGRSLFSKHRSPRVYYFAPWSQNTFGMREQDRKFIYNATKDSWEMFDLASDPQETENLAAKHPAATTVAKQRMAAWVQNQIRFMKERTGAGAGN